MIGRYAVYLRKAVEERKPIFTEAFVLTDVELEKLKETDPRCKFESLQTLRITNGYNWSGQYLNDPVDQDTVEFKKDWFKALVTSDDLSLKLATAKIVLSIDPAFRLKQHNDFSGLCLTATTKDNLVYVLEAKQAKVNPTGLLEEIFRLVGIYKPSTVVLETAQAQLLLSQLIQDEMRKRNLFFYIEEISPGSEDNKAARIRGLIPHYASGRIIHAAGLQDLEAQLSEFPRNSHDDIIDALAYQIPYWLAPGKDSVVTQERLRPGSWEWWKQDTKSKPLRLQKLFRDIR